MEDKFSKIQSGEGLGCRAVLVGIEMEGGKGEVEKSVDELERLLDTAGGETIAKVIQNKSTPDPRTLIGSGKVQEVKKLCEDNKVDLVVFDTELSPSQIKNLEDGIDVRVIDRSMLILDIFLLSLNIQHRDLWVRVSRCQDSEEESEREVPVNPSLKAIKDI